MIVGLYCLAVILAGYLSWQDWRTQSIPMLGLLSWLVISVLSAIYGTPSLAVFCLLFGVSANIALYQRFSEKTYIGIADLIILTSLSAWIHLPQLPILLLICGLFGLISAMLLKSKRFPFLPALFLSALITYFL